MAGGDEDINQNKDHKVATGDGDNAQSSQAPSDSVGGNDESTTPYEQRSYSQSSTMSWLTSLSDSTEREYNDDPVEWIMKQYLETLKNSCKTKGSTPAGEAQSTETSEPVSEYWEECVATFPESDNSEIFMRCWPTLENCELCKSSDSESENGEESKESWSESVNNLDQQVLKRVTFIKPVKRQKGIPKRQPEKSSCKRKGLLTDNGKQSKKSCTGTAKQQTSQLQVNTKKQPEKSSCKRKGSPTESGIQSKRSRTETESSRQSKKSRTGTESGRQSKKSRTGTGEKKNKATKKAATKSESRSSSRSWLTWFTGSSEISTDESQSSSSIPDWMREIDIRPLPSTSDGLYYEPGTYDTPYLRPHIIERDPSREELVRLRNVRERLRREREDREWARFTNQLVQYEIERTREIKLLKEKQEYRIKNKESDSDEETDASGEGNEETIEKENMEGEGNQKEAEGNQKEAEHQKKDEGKEKDEGKGENKKKKDEGETN